MNEQKGLAEPGKLQTVLLIYLFFCMPRNFRNTVALSHW